LVVPETLITEVIKQNHDPTYISHPGNKRAYSLISLRFWWPGMGKSIAEYIKSCDSCQRRKGDREFRAPLGRIEEPMAPFEVTSMDITGPYLQTPRGHKYLLTFIDNFSRYVEAYPIKDQTAHTCAKVYVTQIVARHGTGAQLITDQGRAFMSTFFQETCKLLGVRRTRTTSYHPSSNSFIERFHRTLHSGLSHYINAANTNWDNLIPYFLMAYRATPNSVTGFSPYYLLHGREMEIPNNDALKARVATGNPDVDQYLNTLKANLKRAIM
jgi:transposase InsO family protein